MLLFSYIPQQNMWKIVTMPAWFHMPLKLCSKNYLLEYLSILVFLNNNNNILGFKCLRALCLLLKHMHSQPDLNAYVTFYYASNIIKLKQEDSERMHSLKMHKNPKFGPSAFRYYIWTHESQYRVWMHRSKHFWSHALSVKTCVFQLNQTWRCLMDEKPWTHEFRCCCECLS